ncbi:MAG: DUF4145 domain-containing protein [Candidatus Hydrogenedentes bacterium]|nr:DUF4145 domain-containing protein [Candidatus Hydrogenedentota bacterium]
MLSPKLKKRYIDHFDELIREGERIQAGRKTKDYVYDHGDPEHGLDPIIESTEEIDSAAFYSWRSRCTTLLENVTRQGSVHTARVDETSKINETPHAIMKTLGHLRAMKQDLEDGFMDDLSIRIESEVASDYLAQAEQLLSEGKSGTNEHIPAAVLTGAVLEKALRTLCDKQTPPIPTTNPDGKPKTLDPLITDLKKSGLYEEFRAKQLRTWAALRNHAAHGQFGEFTRHDVEQMVAGVTRFLADYLS